MTEPDFAGAREWIAKLDAADLDKRRLDKWMEKMEAEYERVGNEARDAADRILELEMEAVSVEALVDLIEDHRLGIRDDDELHRLG